MFRERSVAEALSVSELNGIIKGIFDSNRLLSSVTVKGEISNYKAHSSGHLYFSLKDEGGQIRAVMFRGHANALRFEPENGMRVIVSGSVSVYTRDGSYQLYATSMQPDGIGSLYIAYEQLKNKLASEGLFDEIHKKPIPRYPERVGVVTSPTGAAVRDIINVITRRYPHCEIYLYPSLVQGEGAEENIVRAIEYLDRSAMVDTIIIGRGGGSIEDLWAFNGERLARCIFAANTPIISAVGHETDFTIADFVADLRAPTPSAAAELAVPDYRELCMRIDGCRERCDNSLERTVGAMRDRLLAVAESDIMRDPVAMLAPHRDELSECINDFSRAIGAYISTQRMRFTASVGKLEALSPLAVLSRGYSVVYKCGTPITDASETKIGDDISIRLSNGRINATVNATGAK